MHEAAHQVPLQQDDSVRHTAVESAASGLFGNLDPAAADSNAGGLFGGAASRPIESQPQEACSEACSEEVHEPDGRTLPLDGVTIEALQRLAAWMADSRWAACQSQLLGGGLTYETTTEQACEHFIVLG